MRGHYGWVTALLRNPKTVFHKRPSAERGCCWNKVDLAICIPEREDLRCERPCPHCAHTVLTLCSHCPHCAITVSSSSSSLFFSLLLSSLWKSKLKSKSKSKWVIWGSVESWWKKKKEGVGGGNIYGRSRNYFSSFSSDVFGNHSLYLYLDFRQVNWMFRFKMVRAIKSIHP